MIIAAALLAAVLAADEPPRAEPAQPICQLSGDVAQHVRDDGAIETVDVDGRTLSAVGAGGTDLGVPAEVDGHTYLAFGDTLRFRRDTQRWIVDAGWGQLDAVAELRLPDGLDALPPLAAFAAPRAARPALTMFADGAGSHRAQPVVIDGLDEGDGYGEYQVPTGGFGLDGRWYLFFNVRAAWTKPKPTHVYFLRDVLACATPPAGGFSDATPPRFAFRYVASEHAPPADLDAPTPDEDAHGRFVHCAAAVADRAALDACGARAQLPDDLRGAERVVLLWGASWRYPHSDLYLAAVDAARIDEAVGRAPAAWRYRTRDGWSTSEGDCAPQIADWASGPPCIGEHSVAWSPGLHRFVLLYQRDYYQIMLRTAPAPWGPWSAEQLVFHSIVHGARFIHRPGNDALAQLPSDAAFPDGTPLVFGDEGGAAYGPYLLARESIAGDGAVIRYFTMSTWRPYQAHLMRLRVHP